jgi:hypothetical protein
MSGVGIVAGVVAALAIVFGLLFYLLRWLRSRSQAADGRLEKLRTQDATIAGLRTAVAERDETIDTLNTQLAAANRALGAAREQYDEILADILASGGNPSGLVDRVNAALERLSKLPAAKASTAANDRQDT